MSVVVDCTCGKTYQKPERKAGTTFRCHNCGRELTVPLTQPLADLPFAVQAGPSAAAVPAPAPTAPIEDDVIAPPRRGVLRTLCVWTLEAEVPQFAAWVLILIGLIGVVGGAGEVLIFCRIDQANRNQAAADGQFAGNVLVQPRRSADVTLGYAIGIGSIVVGVVMTSAGLVLRHSTASPFVPRRRKTSKRRLQAALAETAPARTDQTDACPECGAAMTPEAILCIACGFNRNTGERLHAAVASPVRHFLPQGGWLLRLFICALLLPLGALAVLALVHEPWARAVAGPGVGVPLLLLGGSWRRLTVLRDDADRPWLVTRRYFRVRAAAADALRPAPLRHDSARLHARTPGKGLIARLVAGRHFRGPDPAGALHRRDRRRLRAWPGAGRGACRGVPRAQRTPEPGTRGRTSKHRRPAHRLARLTWPRRAKCCDKARDFRGSASAGRPRSPS
jgi:hypothetical protein